MNHVITSLTPIKKADAARQLVYGEVYAPNRLDSQGEMMLAEDIELMAHRYLRLKLDDTVDLKHNQQSINAYPVESFIAREGDPDYTPGAWVLGLKIEDDDVWKDIVDGKLNAISFQALTKNVEVVVDVEVIRDHVGKTEDSVGHDHFYFVQLNDNGKVVAGRTSKAADGHYHEIKGSSVTVEASDHSHRFFV